MPRDGSNIYSKPPGTAAAPNETITSSQFNTTIDDLVNDANAPRPISIGGTGATSQATAFAALVKPSILGTVAQIGGVPTGAILEKGSGPSANGRYTRFADGTQICWVTHLPAYMTTTARLGATWTFVKPFVNLNYVLTGTQRPDTNEGESSDITANCAPSASEVMPGVRADGKALSAVNFTIYRVAGLTNFQGGDFIYSDLMAIGRWF